MKPIKSKSASFLLYFLLVVIFRSFIFSSFEFYSILFSGCKFSKKKSAVWLLSCRTTWIDKKELKVMIDTKNRKKKLKWNKPPKNSRESNWRKETEKNVVAKTAFSSEATILILVSIG